MDHGHLLIRKSTVPLHERNSFFASITSKLHFADYRLQHASINVDERRQLGHLWRESSVGREQAQHPRARELTSFALLRTAGIPKCGKDRSNQGRVFGIAALGMVC
jgi:hypothetical protein